MLLQVKQIHKSYGAKSILTDASLQIRRHERAALVGPNGAGKSTLLKIIIGQIEPDHGEVSLSKEATLGYLAQNSGLKPENTIHQEMLMPFQQLIRMEQELREMEREMSERPRVAEDDAFISQYTRLSHTFEDAGGYQYEANIRSVLHGLGFPQDELDTRIAVLSGGQKTRVALAKLLLTQPDLLILDEPTNYLDIQMLTWLENYLKHYPGALLIVSHDRYFLDQLVQTVYELKDGVLRHYSGNYSQFVKQKRALLEQELKRFVQQQQEIARMEDFIQRNIARASTTKRAQSRQKALEKAERLSKPKMHEERAAFRFTAHQRSGNEVLKVDGLSVYVEDRPLLSDISFALTREERAALIGPNGIGKSTLLKALTGQWEKYRGEIKYGSRVVIGYYDQEQKGLNPDQTVLDEVWNHFPHLEEVRIRTILGNLRFSGDDVLKRIQDLSGGEKARVALAKLMLSQANFLIFDEPTNHLDIYSKEMLEEALDDYDGTILFVSHDRYFLNKMATRTLELTPDGIISYLGNYDYMLEKKREQEALGITLSPHQHRAGEKSEAGSVFKEQGAEELSYAEAKAVKQRERQRQRRIEALEREIEAYERCLHELNEQLARPEIYLDYVSAQAVQEEIDETKSRMEACMLEWEALLTETEA
jgi:ATP-binding cassette subfamily F protein 3